MEQCEPKYLIYIAAQSFFTTPRNKIIIKWPPLFLIQVQLKKFFAILLLVSFVTIWQKMGKFGEGQGVWSTLIYTVIDYFYFQKLIIHPKSVKLNIQSPAKS